MLLNCTAFHQPVFFQSFLVPDLNLKITNENYLYVFSFLNKDLSKLYPEKFEND